MDWLGGRVERDEGVMLSRNASAPGPEKWCCTLGNRQNGTLLETRCSRSYMCPTSNRLAFSRVHLCESIMLRSLY